MSGDHSNPVQRQFASDTAGGVHPEVFAALAAANAGPAIGYGDDRWTKAAAEKLRAVFGPTTEAFFVFAGTGANVLAVRALTQQAQAVFCAPEAHIHVDECGAPEAFARCKLVPVPSTHGKITPAAIEPYMGWRGSPHHPQPAAISISQPTEVGTVYTVQEMRALADFAHANGMRLHVDGARLANAAVSLGVELAATSREAGADVVCFGGTKNGLMFGEAVLFFDPAAAEGFEFIRKQGAQLASKMRFISAQFSAILENDLWRRNAAHANAMARRLEEAVRKIPQVKILHPVETNAIFAQIPPEWIAPLQKHAFFYPWNPAQGVVRWMTVFDTKPEDVDAFAEAIGVLAESGK